MNVMPKLLTPLALAAGLLATSATAFAHPGHAESAGRGRLGRAAGPMDLDRDGWVTRPEMRRAKADMVRFDLRRIDVDRDGWLSPRELRRAPANYRAYLTRDNDRDGRSSRFERRTARRARRNGVAVSVVQRRERQEAMNDFRRLDRNRDGRLNRNELGLRGNPGRRNGRRRGW